MTHTLEGLAALDLATAGATELLSALRRREISSRELLEAYLDRVERLNPDLNAVITLDVEVARAAAARADDATARGHDVGALHGLPITIKDSLETAGLRTTAGAPELAKHVPTRDADAVARLREQGAIIFGKTNLPVYAMDWQTANPVFGITRNPWDRDRTPGGSSGGAAVAVAAGLTGLDIGSDIRGSLRQPAHNTGVFTLKPSFGIVAGRGHIPGPPGMLTSPDMGVIGPMTRSADDLDLALDVLAGPSTATSKAWRLRLPAARGATLGDYRIACWLDDPHCPVDSPVLDALTQAVGMLKGGGARIDSRIGPVGLAESDALFERLFAAAISGGAADWNLLHEQRARLQEQWATFFTEYDALLIPAAPVAALPHLPPGDLETRTFEVNGQPRPYTDLGVWAGLAGVAYLPAAVAPVGFTGAGLPVGVQIVAPYLEDRTAIDVARHVESVLGGFRPPPLG
jgi:amidase